MGFSTFKKRAKKEEIYPNEAVLVQYGYDENNKHSKTSFELSTTALKELDYIPNSASINSITNGYDDNNKLVLAALDDGSMYTSKITAKNTFSSQVFMNRLQKEFDLNTKEEHVFSLDIIEEDGIKLVYLHPYGDFSEKLDYESIEKDVEDTSSFDEYINQEHNKAEQEEQLF